MPEEPNDPGMAARAADSLTDAKYLVDSATQEVVQVGQRVKAAINHPSLPKSIRELAEDITRSAPLTMLAVAFVAGMFLASGRRRY